MRASFSLLPLVKNSTPKRNSSILSISLPERSKKAMTSLTLLEKAICSFFYKLPTKRRYLSSEGAKNLSLPGMSASV